MYWAIYTVQECTRTKLCYRYRPMAKEELGKGLPAMNGKRRAYQKAQSGNEEEKPVRATRAKGDDVMDKS